MSILSARSLSLLLESWRDQLTGPAYVALAKRVRLLILDGRIPLGTRIPAERDLAVQLGISRTTVTAAYGELREAGYLDSVRGSGSVARLPGSHSPAPDLVEGRHGLLDFTKASMPATPAVADAALAAAAELPAYLGLSGFDPVGIPALRESIAARYSARGLPTDADQVMVTIGAQHAIALLARVLLSRGDRALIESPSYPHAMEALRDHGARLVGVNVSSPSDTWDGGWDQTALEQAFQRTSPTLAYLMPEFHNPTAMTMPAWQRARVAELADAAGTTLLIDETMADLAIDDVQVQPPFAVHTSAAVMIGSLGKSMWGGLRIGWIRADRPLIQRLIRGRDSGDLGTPILEQLVAVQLLAQYDDIIESRRTLLRAGRDHLVTALADRLPEWSVPRPAGGLTAWVNIGSPVSSQLTLAARNEGLLLAAGPRFGIDGAFERFLRIPYAHPLDNIDTAVDALARAWRSVGRFAVADTDYLASVV
jgi:DNA-binding transcriptional MocR family regulator